MRFAVSTLLYLRQRLAREHLLELAEFGFREVELFAALGHFDYHDARAIDDLAGWLADAGLRLHSVHAPIADRVANGQWGQPLSTAAADEAARTRAVREAQAAAAIAARIPFGFLVLHAGLPDAMLPAGEDNGVAAARRSIEEIGAAAAPAGVKLAVEVIPNRISEADRLVGMLEDEVDLPPPGAGICLDLGHAFLMGDVADTIETVSGHLITTHVHDNRGKADEHFVPFDGRIDWATALMSLRKVGYEGALVLELADTDSPRAALERARDARKRFEEILAD